MWGNPFTPWLLERAEVGATFLDGTVMWTVTSIASMLPPPPTVSQLPYGGIDSYQRNPAIGGSPVAFLNYIRPTPFEPLIHEHWDEFNSFWQEELARTSQLYAVEIVFNAEIYLGGRGMVPEYIQGGIPQSGNFTGPKFRPIKKEIAKIADRLGIAPVTMRNAALQLPNLVFITSPFLPEPGQSGHYNRGGKYSNL